MSSAQSALQPVPQLTRPEVPRRAIVVQLAFLVLLATVSLLALTLGRFTIPPLQTTRILLSTAVPMTHTWTSQMETVILDVRLPRILAAILVGSGLALSGASFQGLFRNPLVSPHLLGVASGAGFGAALAILVGAGFVATEIAAFVFGLIAVAMAYALSRTYRSTPILMLVLSGTIVAALFSALTSLIKYVADPLNKMPAITFWLLGSLNNVAGRDLLLAGPVFVVCALILLLVRWRINLLSMGEEDARAMGVHVERLKAVIVVCATFITAAAVSISGIIGWIGLVVPHMGRLLVGPDHKYLLPVTVLLGGSYLVLVDLVARTAMDSEIPIGILTAVIGAPVFAYLLRKNRSSW
jgi:iron complex transport system permease protein